MAFQWYNINGPSKPFLENGDIVTGPGWKIPGQRQRRRPLVAIFRWLSVRHRMSPINILLVVGMYATIGAYPCFHHISPLVSVPVIIVAVAFVAIYGTEKPAPDSEARLMNEAMKIEGAEPGRRLSEIIAYNRYRVFRKERSRKVRGFIFGAPALAAILLWRHELDNIWLIHAGVVHIVHYAHNITAWLHEAYAAVRDWINGRR